MIVSIDWLKELVPFKVKPKDIANDLTAIGLESTFDKDQETLNIELTPNRPDCMSHLGVSREIALITGENIIIPKSTFKESSFNISNEINIKIENEKGCLRYSSRVIKGVKVGPSPEWIVLRLEKCGIRSINNIVDISNYVLLELGHPLHAFDLNLLVGNTINVRSANKGETIITLDGENRKLSKDHLLICDNEKPVALAGIMGGKNTEVTEKTTNILVECAYFDPVTIRRGAKILGISTEASKRFERGVDYDDAHEVLDRTTELILKIAGGDCCKGIIDNYPETRVAKSVILNPKDANSVLGVNVDNKFISKTFDSLRIKHFVENGSFVCTIPSNRPDLERPIDLIEEIGRVFGFDKIESRNNYVGIIPDDINDEERHLDSLRDYFRGIGFSEVMTNSLISLKDAELFSKNTVEVSNPLSREMSILRPSLLPGLLFSVRHNIRRGESNLSLFECGTVFSIEKKQWLEEETFSGVVCGNILNKGWRNEKKPSDIFLMKGIMADFAKRYNLDASFNIIEHNNNFLQSGLIVESDGTKIAQFGNINFEILDHFEIEIPIIGFDFNLGVFKRNSRGVKFSKLPQFPGIERDLSLTVLNSITISQLETIILKKGGDFLQSVKLYDLYDGGQIEKGYQSVTFALFFRSNERTLQDSDIDIVMDLIISETSTSLGAKLR